MKVFFPGTLIVICGVFITVVGVAIGVEVMALVIVSGTIFLLGFGSQFAALLGLARVIRLQKSELERYKELCDALVVASDVQNRKSKTKVITSAFELTLSEITLASKKSPSPYIH